MSTLSADRKTIPAQTETSNNYRYCSLLKGMTCPNNFQGLPKDIYMIHQSLGIGYNAPRHECDAPKGHVCNEDIPIEKLGV